MKIPSGKVAMPARPLKAKLYIFLLLTSLTFCLSGPARLALAQGEASAPPILVITSPANPFTSYYSEILRAEGLSLFTTLNISALTPAVLASTDVAILGEMPLTPAQVTLLGNWVAGGGNLIAMRPDQDLAKLLGLKPITKRLRNAYLLVNTSTGPGVGIVRETIQFHGQANLYELNGATALATLYSTATKPTLYPAVTWREVGSKGGQAAAFTFDLARSVVYTRQGNPAWAGQNRDGTGPIIPSDLFYGPATFDPQPPWLDYNKVAIPQADEQQRLLANMILQMSLDRQPLPRFWYLPRGLKAVIVMTGDEHGGGGTAGRLNGYLAHSLKGCSVADWECVRSTAYVYPDVSLTNTMAADFRSKGFEIALHVNTGCASWTPASLRTAFNSQVKAWRARYTDLPAPTTHRIHCLAWSDYATQPIVELAYGMRLDTNYYYYSPAWTLDRPGFFTGSGLPMRFADARGRLINVYQAATQLPDDGGLSYPAAANRMLDRALGPPGYYGAFVANMHLDQAASAPSEAIIASALARQVPVISSRQLLTWLDGRNNSTFSGLAWSGNTLRFTISARPGAKGLQAMVPVLSGAGPLKTIKRQGTPKNCTIKTIKGIEYAFFSATSGSYEVIYGPHPRLEPLVEQSVENAGGLDAAEQPYRIALPVIHAFPQYRC